MGSCRTLNIIGAATLLVSLCAVAAYAAPAATAADMPATPPNAENQPVTNSSNKVTITAPRPLTQTPGVLSLDGLSLTSPLAVTDAPSQPLVPNSYFGGGGGMPHKLLLGSAPSPTPDDLCAYGSTALHCFTDSFRKERKQYIADPLLPGHFREVRPGDEKIVERQIRTEKLIHAQLFLLEK